jgi:hypothetical protein
MYSNIYQLFYNYLDIEHNTKGFLQTIPLYDFQNLSEPKVQIHLL